MQFTTEVLAGDHAEGCCQEDLPNLALNPERKGQGT